MNVLTHLADALRSYLTQTRSELAVRLCDRLYPPEHQLGPDGQPTGQMGPRATKPSKWWMSFQKRRLVGTLAYPWQDADSPTGSWEGVLEHEML